MNIDDILDTLEPKKTLPNFRTGDTVRVHVRIKEGEKERIQLFEGVVIKKKRGGRSAGFTVRKISYGVGVERIFPMESPIIEKIEVIQQGKVRKSRLFYLRGLRGRDAQIQELENQRMESDTKGQNGSTPEAKVEDSKDSKESGEKATKQSAMSGLEATT